MAQHIAIRAQEDGDDLGRCCIEECSLGTKEDGFSMMRAEKKSPSRWRVMPYIISTDVHDRSSLRVARTSRRTIVATCQKTELVFTDANQSVKGENLEEINLQRKSSIVNNYILNLM